MNGGAGDVPTPRLDRVAGLIQNGTHENSNARKLGKMPRARGLFGGIKMYQNALYPARLKTKIKIRGEGGNRSRLRRMKIKTKKDGPGGISRRFPRIVYPLMSRPVCRKI